MNYNPSEFDVPVFVVHHLVVLRKWDLKKLNIPRMKIPFPLLERSCWTWPITSNITVRFFFLAFSLFASIIAKAEGSKDFVSYDGYRMFLDTRDTQQIKVYANVDEYINVGSSHLGIQGGFITIYRPDGSMAMTLTGNSGNQGIIFNDTMEMAGPTGGGTTNGIGYEPSSIMVLPGEEGVWTIYFGYPDYSPADFPNLLNNASWTRANDQPNTPRVVLAWDITVTQFKEGNNGGLPLSGRVYTNEFISVINQNGYSTSPEFHILTKDGFIFRVDFMDADPFRFPISSNSGGFLRDDLQPVYTSQPRNMIVQSDDPTTWMPGSYYLYEPQAEDYDGGVIVNNKIFFNPPDKNLPPAALTTDIFGENTHNTWLRINPLTNTVEITNFQLLATDTSGVLCTNGFIQAGQGANFSFNSNVSGTASLDLDLNNDGDFFDPEDRNISRLVSIGNNQIYWDGKDGLGDYLPNDVDINLEYLVKIRGGETHILLTDVENNEGGVVFSLVNNVQGSGNDLFYYDHTPIGGTVSGGGSPGNPLPTNIPYTYQNNFGNNKILDYWAFYNYDGQGEGTLVFQVTDDCNDNPNPGPDRDGDGIADSEDLDDDNDGVPDMKEYCNPGNGFACLPSSLDPSKDADGDGVSNLMDANDPAFINPCTDTNNDGTCDSIASIFDTDRDGIPDHFDLDSDNDGITDLVEAGHGQPDADGNGIIDGLPVIFGLNGLYNPIASDPDDFNAVETYSRFDVDSDGVPDHDDLDSDNDGINDVAEAGYAAFDTNNDGRIDDGAGNPPLTGLTGLAPIIDPLVTGNQIPLPADKDGDNVPDWHDLDSDNDLIHDVEEGGNIDPDNDAIIGVGLPAVNIDGQATGANLIPTSHPLDSDSDLVADFHDLDTDNDGINDVREADGIDQNDDGLPGVGVIAVNNNGVPTMAGGLPVSATSTPTDTDADLIADYRDLDSDNDIINDVAETNKLDNDNDGRVGQGIPPVNIHGQATSIVPTSFPTDTDGDGTPDFREKDSDDDGIFDVQEANEPDPDFDGIVGMGIPVVNSDGLSNGFLSTSKPTDTDGDGTPDFQELDSDNDGILDVEECPINIPCIDGDGDNTADFQDPDRDDDGIFDGYECETGFPCPDTDNDGIPDVDDLDTDGDLLLDIDECPLGNPCPDANVNGIPEWREFFCNPNIIVPVVENISSNGTSFCEGSSVTLTADNNIDVDGDSITYQWVGPNGFDHVAIAPEFGPFTVEINAATSLNEGEYTLFLFTQGGCVGIPSSLTLEVSTTPQTPEIQVNNDELCVGEILELNSSVYSGSNVTYQWYFDNGVDQMLIGTTTVPTYFINNVEFDNAGIYTVQVSVDNCISLESNAQDITVSNVFSQTPLLNVDEDVLCSGEVLELNSSIIQGNNIQYQWWFDDGSGPVSIGVTDVPTFFINNVESANSGIYNVTVLFGSCESQLSNSQDIIINEELTGVVPALEVEEEILCEGQTLELNSSAYNGTDVLYHWWLNDGSSTISLGTTNVPTLFLDNVTASNSGDYTVVISSGNCVSQASNVQDVLVNNDLAFMVPQLSIDEDLLCLGQTIELNSTTFPGPNLQYEWWFDDGTGPISIGVTSIPTFFIPNASIANSGIYTVTIIMGLCQTQPSNAQDLTVTDAFLTQTPTLSVFQDQPCEGETIELNSTIFNGGNVTYNWWFKNGNGFVLLGSTDLPTFFISNANDTNSGIYAVTAAIGNCETQFSNAQDIIVTDDLSSQTPSLTVNQNLVCEGEMLELNSTVVTGNNVVYEWWFNDGSGFVSLGTTDVPTYFIDNTTASNEGIYQVTFSVGNCTSQFSNSQAVSMTGDLTNQTPQLAANQNTLCEGNTLELNSSIINGGNVTYEWFFDDGSGAVSLGTTNVPTLFIDNLAMSNSGVYTVLASIGNCTTQPSNAQSVTVNNVLGMAPELSIDTDVICEGEMLELNSSMIQGANVVYHWWFNDGNGAVEIGSTNLPTLFIANADNSNTGIYTVSVNVGGCVSQPSNAQDIAVQMAPDLEISNTTDSVSVACPGDLVELSAPMILGATYQWTGPQGFSATTINPIIDQVSIKNAGDYYVVVETAGCSFLSETTEVFVFDELLAEEDNFQITLEDSLVTSDFIENDAFGNINNWEINVVSPPINGQVTIGDQNQIVYKPSPGQVGNDMFIYQICNPDCPDQCDNAVVNIRIIKENEEDGSCFVPNVITPNEDGANDYLVVPCLESEFTNNNMKIFNRWGDLVFEAQPYKNDWKGTYRNTPLPPGTYFYVLQLDLTDSNSLQGYFTITR